jgi:hypothetical protein
MESFDRCNSLALDLMSRVQAGVDSSTVDDYRAGPTLALAAAFLGPGQAHRAAQDIDEAQMSIDRHINF